MLRNFLLILIISFSVGTLTVINVISLHEPYQFAYGEFSAVASSTPENIIKSETTKDTIYFVGDVMLARHVEYLMDKYGANYPYKQIVFPNMENSFLVGNFESSIAPKHKKTPNFNFQFSSNPKYVGSLREFGFTHLSLANNHSFDYGTEGYQNAGNILKNNNIITFGHPTQAATSSMTYLELQNHTIALIGLHNLFITPTKEEVGNIFSQSSNSSDLQIAYVHWGTEYSLIQSEEQRQFAEMLVEAGADVVIGHHPHVVQGIERIEGSPVFYSLGNFIFDQYFNQSVREGLVLALKDISGELSIELLPVSSANSLAQPSFMSEADGLTFLTSLSERSEKNLDISIKNRNIALINKLATSTETAIMAQ